MDMLADAALGPRPVADLPKHLPDERVTLLEQQPPDFTAAHRQERQRPIVDFGVWRPGGRSRRAEFEARAPLEPCPTQGSGLATSTNAWHPFRAADAAGWRLAHASTAR